MSGDTRDGPGAISRRDLLKAAGVATVAVGLGGDPARASGRSPGSIAFHGVHQAGVTTPQQARLVFAAFDVTAMSRSDLRALLVRWSTTAADLCAGRPAATLVHARSQAPTDSGEAAGLGAAGLTLTFGLGPGVFDERFGLASARPAPLADLPPFAGDQLDPRLTGGDLCVQACADDPQVAEHAVRNLARLADGAAVLRWQQHGFISRPADGGTPRNMLGFKDGTNNLDAGDEARMRANVWAAADSSPAWMLGGTYLVARRIRNFVEHWDSSSLAEQERSIGRRKASGAPLGARQEDDPVDPRRLPPDAHIIVANPRTGAASERERILRRGYGFADGLDPLTSLRRGDDGSAVEGLQDSGLMFLAFQQDPRRQFVTIQARLAASDHLDEYLAHVGSGIFAIPPGVPGRGGYIGQTLLG
jgi:deferrochelatase/peroxidase EfeB